KSGTVGDAIVTAAVSSNANDRGKGTMVTFTTNITTTTATVLSLTPNTTTAQVVDKTPVVFTAVVKDSGGNVVSNASVRFTTTGGTLNQETATTNASGEATASLTSPVEGNITVTANVENNPADQGQSATVIFIISSVVNLTSNATTAIADGKSAILFTATVKD
ncbi:Ig-like domain-containing protein, partial [Pectobacterium brasiliense]|uniref:Ig-like domain-containing protein n=1 Tax=Pectobacterium brasiliense TaxID=180957 RepID=UPI00190F459A